MARIRPRRGDVFWVILDPTVGSEIRKTRPAVVVSNESCNAFGARIVVVPLTSSVSSLYPGEAKVRVSRNEARAVGDQMRSIDKARLGRRIGRLSATNLAAVEDALRITLAL